MDNLVPALVAAGVGVFAVGPVLNYAIVRWIGWRVALPAVLGFVPERQQVGAPPVRCRRCQQQLSTQPVPTWAWMARRGRCPGCGEPISWPTAAVEVVTGLAFGVVAWRIGWSAALLPILCFSAGLVAASAVDLVCWRIPTRFVYVGTVVLVATMVTAAIVAGEIGSLTGALVGGVAYFGMLASLHLLSPRLLGFGDVRLGLLIGLAVGWMAWTADQPVLDPLGGVLQALFMASLVGMVVGIALLVARGRSEPYPFAPWLSLGAFLTILAAAPGPL